MIIIIMIIMINICSSQGGDEVCIGRSTNICSSHRLHLALHQVEGGLFDHHFDHHLDDGGYDHLVDDRDDDLDDDYDDDLCRAQQTLA